MEFFDTHCHINDKRFNDDRAETITRAREAGVTKMVVIGISRETSEQCAKIAGEFDGVYAAVGIQPNCAHETKSGDWERILSLLDQPSVIALGETGLDRYWDDCPLEIQEEYFDLHLRASQERDVPFVVHMRECGDDVLRMLTEARERGPLRGVMHSFTGDMDLMLACVELGMFISFAGMATFKRSTELREIAAAVPEDRLLIETDAPYLSPEPMRKVRRNEPAMVVHTGQCLADARGVSLETMAAATTRNAHQFFGI
jgi:TatD DNase family protein